MLYPDVNPLPSKRNTEQTHQRRADRERLPEMRREGHSVCDLGLAEVSKRRECRRIAIVHRSSRYVGQRGFGT